MRPETGRRYTVKHGGELKEMLCLDIIPPSNGRREHYLFRSLRTNREIVIKSKEKIKALA